MQTIKQVRAAGLPCFPCSQEKVPLVHQGEDWRKVATTVHGAEESSIGGLPVPVGVLIVDLDLYKGVTRETASKALGGSIPWQQSLIQITRRGGEHHAFRVDFEVKQRSNYPIEGLDTKVAGKGYICFGQGYTATNGSGVQGYTATNESGVLRLLNIYSLPELPIKAREILKKTIHVKKFSKSITETNINDLDLLGALGTISPWCDRDEWLSVGMALKSEFGATEACFNLFDKWSRGDLDIRAGVPENYDAKTQGHQWASFSNDGKTKIETIYYKATQNGWKPMHKYAELIGKLPSVTGTAPPQPVMKDLDAPPPPMVLKATQPPPPAISKIIDVEDIEYKQLPLENNFHLMNAEMIIHHCLDNRVLKIDGFIHWWSGREWQYFSQERIDAFLWKCLPLKMDKASIFNSIRQAFNVITPRVKSKKPCKRIFFKDVVVDSVTGEVTQHNRDNLNCGTLSVNYNSGIVIVKWLKFLESMFGVNDDRILLLQEFFGWFLISHNLGIEKYIAFIGATRAGKGTVLKVLMHILGEANCGPINFNTLGSPHSHEIMRKYNVVVDLEAKAPVRQDRSEAAATLLKVTANETMSSRQFYTTESIQGAMNTKIAIACNKIPTLLDDSGASASRVMILLHDKSFKGKEHFGLYDELITERSGIVMWALGGLQRLTKNKWVFTMPVSSLDQQNDFKDNSQPLSEFIEEYIVFDPLGRCFTRELYKVFEIYSKETGFRIMNRKIFIRALKETLLSKEIKWSRFRIGDENLQGVIGLKIKYPNHLLSCPASMS